MNAHNEQHDPASAVVKQNLTTRPAAAPGIDLAADHDGMRVDHSGLFKQVRAALRDEPGLAEMVRQLHGHLVALGRRWYAGDKKVVDELLQLYCIEPDARRALIDASPKGDLHADDLAVDAFAAAMKAKLADARAKGRGGWQDDEPGMQQRLSDMLRAHVEKGDPRDVANFCMFLHQRGEGISAPAPIPRPMDTAPRDGTVVRLLVQFEEHLIEDTDEPAWTIGACNDDLVPDDERTGWQVAGWCWEHDHFTEGKGTPVGWLPMLDSPKGGSEALDAARWRAVDAASSNTTLRLHSARPGERAKVIDAAMQAQTDEAPTYTTGHCENHRRPGGCPLHNLQCGYPQCDRRQAGDAEVQP